MDKDNKLLTEAYENEILSSGLFGGIIGIGIGSLIAAAIGYWGDSVIDKTKKLIRDIHVRRAMSKFNNDPKFKQLANAVNSAPTSTWKFVRAQELARYITSKLPTDVAVGVINKVKEAQY